MTFIKTVRHLSDPTFDADKLLVLSWSAIITWVVMWHPNIEHYFVLLLFIVAQQAGMKIFCLLMMTKLLYTFMHTSTIDS